MKNKSITLAGHEILPGTHVTLNLPSASLYTQTKMQLPIHVFHGKKAGPRIFITGGIHGDELNSIEILRRLHNQKWINDIKGTLITIPVVNMYGFIIQSRYLPDRRDLNRSFPGSKSGSLAAKLAYMINEEIICQCQYGIDLHTGSYGKANLPQLRVNLETPGAKELSLAFNVPIIVDARIRDGSLRQAASEYGIPVLVYEGGEALRFNELCIRMGVRGIINVLNYLGMTNTSSSRESKYEPFITRRTHWLRAPMSGLVEPARNFVESFVIKKDETLCYIHDPFLMNPSQALLAPFDGILIGLNNLPIVSEGDALFHIARTKRVKKINAFIEELRDEIQELFPSTHPPIP